MSTIRDLELQFQRNVDPGIAPYYNCGSGVETTLRENADAFKLYRLKRAALLDERFSAEDVDVGTSLLGRHVSCPIGVAPTAVQRNVWPDGEVSSAGAAARQRVCFINSLFSNVSVEDFRFRGEDSPSPSRGGLVLWKNLYPCAKEGMSHQRELMRHAESHGVSAFVLTVDAPTKGWTIRPNWTVPLPHVEMPDVVKANTTIGIKPADSAIEVMLQYIELVHWFKSTWNDFHSLTKETSCPLIAKGVLTGDDAVRAASHGAAAVYVSNHGGRQLDGSPATLLALPEVRAAVGDALPVYFDGGIRSGVDVFKALALGADAVFVGRPVLWGLNANGRAGVEEVLDTLRRELVDAMLYTGCRTLKDIDRSRVEPAAPKALL